MRGATPPYGLAAPLPGMTMVGGFGRCGTPREGAGRTTPYVLSAALEEIFYFREETFVFGAAGGVGF
jgi:hypothetical protein